MNEDGKAMVLVLWQCDKKDCEQFNRRWVEIDLIIYDDVCEICGRRIHEPITEIISNVNRKSEE